MGVDPRLPLMIVLGLVGMAVARASLAPGAHRRAFMSLLAAVCFSPGFVGGHGFGVTSVTLLLFASNPVTGSWDPLDGYGMLKLIGAVWIVSFAIGSLAALVSRRRRTADPQTIRSGTREQVGFVIAVHALCLCAFGGSIFYRLHWRDTDGSYGPFSVTVDAGSDALHDIVVHVYCSAPNSFEYYSATVIVRSGQSRDLPRRYLRGSYHELTCRLTTVHPYLQTTAREDPAISVSPRAPIVLPTLHVQPWSDERFRQILAGPGSQYAPAWRVAENAITDDWGSTAGDWVPYFCGADFERIRRQYLPTVAARRTRLLTGHAPFVPDEKSSQDIVLEIWRSSCEYTAQHPLSPAMQAL